MVVRMQPWLSRIRQAQLAIKPMGNGTAPIPVWFGNIVRHRLNRAGNRQLNLVLHRIAVTQLRCAGAGRDYVVHRMTAGDTKSEAIRTFRRQISDEVFRRMTIDY
jgi:transposase